jgi:cytochrome c-type biogenesis protein
MDLTLATYLLPFGLGLLGFVEPCTIGGHLLFLESQNNRSRPEQLKSVSVFIIVRALVAGLIGAAIAWAGARLIGVQNGVWLLFGSIYLLIGLFFLAGRARLIKRRIDLGPEAWKRAQSPVLLGLANGLNIPACAAPILFGLLGMAAVTGTALTGFKMMFVFGLTLSMPLLLIAMVPRFAVYLRGIGARLKSSRWVLGGIFVLLGVWSIWFGLFVDPVDWSQL